MWVFLRYSNGVTVNATAKSTHRAGRVVAQRFPILLMVVEECTSHFGVERRGQAGLPLMPWVGSASVCVNVLRRFSAGATRLRSMLDLGFQRRSLVQQLINLKQIPRCNL
eukprot:GFYU01005057.1.p1 GENE.GFYU01005057.1~~GFYU01005057.1.p1  ORF type:complete len:110 (+),score=0.07 GFYU01005057.1:221-550(+)